jgi:DNA-binding beta-propeller fold protein YncE
VLARAIALALALAALTGCGSRDELPPAAAPAGVEPRSVAVVDGGRAIAVLAARERALEVYDSHTRKRIARAPAGVGPTAVVAGPGELVYVLDTTGAGLLVFDLRPHLRLTRRLGILGSPSGIAADPARQRLWVTTTRPNRILELADGARPHRVSSMRLPQAPAGVAVDPANHRVYVTGADLQIVDGRDR